jgi:hypothetical protein
MCTERGDKSPVSKYSHRGFGVYSMNKTGSWAEFAPSQDKCDKFFSVKIICNYEYWDLK